MPFPASVNPVKRWITPGVRADHKKPAGVGLSHTHSPGRLFGCPICSDRVDERLFYVSFCLL